MSVAPGYLYAQDFAFQMKAFLSQIEQAESISYVSSINIEYTSGPAQKQKIIYQRSSDAVYYKTDKMEMLGDKTVSLMIYPENKVVVWQKTEFDKKALKNQEMVVSDSLLTKPDSIVYLGQTEGFSRYMIYTNKKYIQKMELSFRIADGLLVHAVYYYNQTPNQTVLKSTVDFTEFSINNTPDVAKKWPSVMSYVNKQYSLSALYSGYKLICLDHK